MFDKRSICQLQGSSFFGFFYMVFIVESSEILRSIGKLCGISNRGGKWFAVNAGVGAPCSWAGSDNEDCERSIWADLCVVLAIWDISGFKKRVWNWIKPFLEGTYDGDHGCFSYVCLSVRYHCAFILCGYRELGKISIFYHSHMKSRDRFYPFWILK